MFKKTLITIGILILVLAASIYLLKDEILRWFFTPQNQPQTDKQQETVKTKEDSLEQGVQTQEIPLFTVIAENLEVPWDIEFLPSGDLLVTERPGRLTRVDEGGQKYSTNIPAVKHAGEGGLLGLALHPNFKENSFVYVYVTIEKGSKTVNKVARYEYKNNQLFDETIILDNIPGAQFHDGGQIAFGPDGYLYITTGDARDPNLAQDINSLAGKILRVGESGEIPKDNPFDNIIWSYGHRNPQGLAWDKDKNLWSTEHGRSGLLSGLDELNLVEEGKNYGWPNSQGDTILLNTAGPMLHSGTDVTWAPASLAYLDGKLYWGGLRGETLYEYNIVTRKLKEHFVQEHGRIRAVVVGPDDMLYISTSNRDGRGKVREGDDKIIRVNPENLH